MSDSVVSVRAAARSDLPAIATIYAPYVARTVITFETEPPDAATWTTRFDAITARGLPFLVAESGGGVAGYAYAGPWKERAAYRYTVEDAIYLDPAATGRGIGRALLTSLLDALSLDRRPSDTDAAPSGSMPDQRASSLTDILEPAQPPALRPVLHADHSPDSGPRS